MSEKEQKPPESTAADDTYLSEHEEFPWFGSCSTMQGYEERQKKRKKRREAREAMEKTKKDEEGL